MRTSKRLALAVAMVVGLVLALANPAAAAGPFDLEVGDPPSNPPGSGGTLETAIGTFDLTPGSQGTPPCEDKDSTLQLRTDNDAAGPGTWAVNGTFSGQFQLPPGSGTWYQADFTVNGSGAYAATGSPPPDYDLVSTSGGLDIAVQVRITLIGSASDPDCSKTNIRCDINGVFGITSAGFNGTLPSPSVGDHAIVSADTFTSGLQLVTANCSPPFSAVNATDAILTNFRLEVV